MTRKPLKLLQLGLLSIALGTGTTAIAQTVNSALNAASSKIAKASSAQTKIDKLADQTDSLFAKFQKANKQLENVRVYNAQLELQIKDQEELLERLQASIREASTMEGQMAPLVEEMISGLEQFVELDMPFQLDVRREAVERLKENQSNSLLTAAERFRQILETYRIEADYSKNIESYTDKLNINGVELDVNILRVGRIAMMYQSEDQKLNGVWNASTRSWDELDSSYRKPLSDLYKMANKQASINIMKLPIASTTGG